MTTLCFSLLFWRSKLTGPVPSFLLCFPDVALVVSVDLFIERVIEVRARHNSFDLGEHMSELTLGQPAQFLISLIIRFRPLLEHVDADFTRCIYLRVVNLAAEVDLGRILRVTLRTEYLQREHATFKGRIFWSVHLDEEVPIVMLVLSDSDTFDWLSLYHEELLGAPVLRMSWIGCC